MKILIFILALFTFSAPAYAQDNRVEDITAQIFKDLKKGNFENVDKKLQFYANEDIKTRHGTNTFLEIYEGIIEKINNTDTHEAWDVIVKSWDRKTPKSFHKDFFTQILRHTEAEYYLQPNQAEQLLQSQRRRYEDTLNNSYNRYLNLIEDYKKRWHAHAYLVKNFPRYRLSEKELNYHFLEAQAINKGEITSIQGYVAAMSPYALGRNDKIISQGITSILKKYPEKDLTKPEYIDDATEQEIEDQIFELAIGKMLLSAREYVENSDTKSTASTLVPMAYSIIYDDVNKHYAERTDKINNHPLSFKRRAVWNEIEQHFAHLIENYPDSGKYLSDYLKISLARDDTSKITAIIETLLEKDPNYKPSELKPIQCEYFGRRINVENTQEIIDNMYNACKSAIEFKDNENYIYRAGWAARQKENYSESNELLQRALQKSPKNPTYLTDICWNYKDLKDYDEALDYCDRAIAADKTFARAWLGRSHINYYGLNNPAQSQKDAQMYKNLTGKQGQ